MFRVVVKCQLLNLDSQWVIKVVICFSSSFLEKPYDTIKDVPSERKGECWKTILSCLVRNTSDLFPPIQLTKILAIQHKIKTIEAMWFIITVHWTAHSRNNILTILKFIVDKKLILKVGYQTYRKTLISNKFYIVWNNVVS